MFADKTDSASLAPLSPPLPPNPPPGLGRVSPLFAQIENNFNCLVWLFPNFSKSSHLKQNGKKMIKMGYDPFFKHKIETHCIIIKNYAMTLSEK